MRPGFLRTCVALVSVVLACSGLAFADATPGMESTPIPQSPKPDFSTMKFMLGTWQCSSRSSRRPTPFKTTTVTTLDSTGYWMVVNSTSPKVSWAPAIVSVDRITYDGTFKRWADVYTDDNGGYDVSYSPGWKGGTITWTDALFTPGPDIVSTSPTVTTKVSDSKTTSHSTFKEKSGRTVSFDVACTKG
ncbi:MAG: hypothetical protein JO219_05220 [Candidatus Eremiobacteraeota bacterium]|nr:hypothetical protein [Candidatus Eremiobacteraeota bacterium]MBV8367171.1 hypothetical protein [Candidatus Eremiobacteraeota bacterium]